MLINILLTAHFILLVVISLRVLSRYDLSPPARMAWIVVLLVLPYFGVLVYWMFGEVHLGLGFTRRHREIISKLRSHNPDIFYNDENLIKTQVRYEHRPTIAFAASVTNFHLVSGNKAELMAGADETHQRMIDDFDAATDHIHVMYYIWLEDDMGRDVAYALIHAAKRGVTCRAMVDGMGSRGLVKSKLWRQLEQAGVQISVALPISNIVKVLLTSRFDLRNHRKITIIDGHTGYVGSRNCADPEFRVKPKYAPWVDIMVRVTGPIVAQNQMLFASDWLMENPDTPLSAFSYDVKTDSQSIIKSESDQNDHSDKAVSQNVLAQVFADGPTRSSDETPQFLNTLIGQAQHRLIISTPYFVPDYSLFSTLCATAKRGVAVTMIFPKNNDSPIVSATSHSYYLRLLQAGVKVFEYKPGLLHAKTLTVDNCISLIGSTNLDLRSFDLNYENNVVFYDDVLTAKIIERQYQYIDNSVEVNLKQVEDWPLYYRIWNNIIATLGPIL